MGLEEIDRAIEKLDNMGAIEYARQAYGKWFSIFCLVASFATISLVAMAYCPVRFPGFVELGGIFLYLAIFCWFLPCFMIFISWKALRNERNGDYAYCF